jgi:hypothetical protein
MLVEASRTAIKPVFSRWPMQSDYTVMWGGAEREAKASDSKVQPSSGIWPAWLQRMIRVVKLGFAFKRRMSLRNRRFFEPVSKDTGRTR